MVRHVTLVAICFLLVGCASTKIENGYMIKESTYKVPLVENPAWLRVVPGFLIDGAYYRCPNEQSILVYERTFCGKFDYSTLTAEEYVDRLYKAKSPALCSFTQQPDPDFLRLDGVPTTDVDRKQISMVHERYGEPQLCGSKSEKKLLKVKDVFFEERRRFGQGDASTFLIFRYVSPADGYDDGVGDFDQMVSKFEWLNPEPPTAYEPLPPTRKLDLHGKSFDLEFTDGRKANTKMSCSDQTLDRRTDLEGSVGKNYFRKALVSMIEGANGRIDPKSPNRILVDLKGLSFKITGHFFIAAHGMVEFDVASPHLKKSYCSDMRDGDKDSPLHWYSLVETENARKLMVSASVRRAVESFVNDLASSNLP